MNLRPTAYQAAALPLSYTGFEPYRNTPVNQPDAAVRLANRFQFVYRFSWYSVCAGFRSPQCNRLQGQLMCFYMVGAVRLELTTYRLKADYSNQLSYAPISYHSWHCPYGLSFKRNWWIVTGSNCRHSRCKHDALPTELTIQLNLRAYAAFIVDLFRTYRPPSLTSSTMDITWAPSSVVSITDLCGSPQVGVEPICLLLLWSFEET